jgi:TPR repeat protein
MNLPGHVEAMTAIGGAYDEGTGTDVDRTIAFEWFRRASSLGDASAAYMLGW